MAPEIVEGLIMGSGVIFEWDPVSNTIPRKIFLQDSPNGKHPTGSLTVLDGKIYGMTPEGGANRSGVIFEWDPVNQVFSKKADFSPLVTGRLPYGSLSVFNGKLYGMTYAGGPITRVFFLSGIR
ncbi:MAG: hypothetical protein IPH45_18220 [Bacteroidales bacterium]|nr:hypothetical protein [Bacteroidales bacterium]